MTAIPEGCEVCVPLVTERKEEILQVTMIGGADDKVGAGPKHLLCEAKQVARSDEMFDYLSSDSHIEAGVANRGGIVIYSELMEHQLGRRIFCEPNAVGARLATNHFVSSAGKLAAQCAIATSNVDDATCA